MDAGAERERFEALLRSNLEGVFLLPDDQTGRLYDHYQLLVRWNQVLNLSSIRDLETAVVRHYCESVFLAAHLPRGAVSVADLGSGAGFPGIPLAVARPECSVALIESHQRKAVFLREATRGCANVRVIARRVEQVEERFEWLVSRAVAWADVLVQVPRIAPGVALLVGSADACNLMKKNNFQWDKCVPLPWGRQRTLIFGSSVPRETC